MHGLRRLAGFNRNLAVGKISPDRLRFELMVINGFTRKVHVPVLQITKFDGVMISRIHVR